jgi:hypothetical protein
MRADSVRRHGLVTKPPNAEARRHRRIEPLTVFGAQLVIARGRPMTRVSPPRAAAAARHENGSVTCCRASAVLAEMHTSRVAALLPRPWQSGSTSASAERARGRLQAKTLSSSSRRCARSCRGGRCRRGGEQLAPRVEAVRSDLAIDDAVTDCRVTRRANQHMSSVVAELVGWARRFVARPHYEDVTPKMSSVCGLSVCAFGSAHRRGRARRRDAASAA